MKALFQGVAIAAAAGLICGGVVKYRPRPAPDTPEGPQMLVSGPSARSAYPEYGGAVLTGYGGELPEYVVGTDWLLPVSDAPAPDEPPAPAGGQAIRAAARQTPAPYAPPPERTLTVYPSVDGDILAGIAGSSSGASDRLDAMNAQIAADGLAAAARIAAGPS